MSGLLCGRGTDRPSAHQEFPPLRVRTHFRGHPQEAGTRGHTSVQSADWTCQSDITTGASDRFEAGVTSHTGFPLIGVHLRSKCTSEGIIKKKKSGWEKWELNTLDSFSAASGSTSALSEGRESDKGRGRAVGVVCVSATAPVTSVRPSQGSSPTDRTVRAPGLQTGRRSTARPGPAQLCR